MIRCSLHYQEEKNRGILWNLKMSCVLFVVLYRVMILCAASLLFFLEICAASPLLLLFLFEKYVLHLYWREKRMPNRPHPAGLYFQPKDTVTAHGPSDDGDWERATYKKKREEEKLNRSSGGRKPRRGCRKTRTPLQSCPGGIHRSEFLSGK